MKAELEGIRIARAHGIEVNASAPVLALCRKLVERGVPPATPLEAYRGEVLCLRVRSIGEGAGWIVKEELDGKPRFRKYTPGEYEGDPAHGTKSTGWGPPTPLAIHAVLGLTGTSPDCVSVHPSQG
jgi:hypothetical protein